MDSTLSRAKEICALFEVNHETDDQGNLIFHYGQGLIEHYSPNFHLVPILAGTWQSKNADLNIVREIFLCTTAMDGIAFLYFHAHRYPRHEELLLISLGCCYSFPTELTSIVNKATINFINTNDLTGRITALRFCIDRLNLVFRLKLSDGFIIVDSGFDVLSLPLGEFSLKTFFAHFKIRPFSRQFFPRMGISFLAQLNHSQ